MDTAVAVLKYVGLLYLVLYSGLAALVVLGTINDHRARRAWNANRVPETWTKRYQHERVT